MSDYVIEVDHLSKEFVHWEERPRGVKSALISLVKGEIDTRRHRVQILSNISFKIRAGEFVGIMGRNGVGKSTILKLLSGIYFPTSGSVKVQGKVAPLLELGAGFQDELSGYENIFLNAAILGYSRAEIFQMVDEIISFSELGEKIEMPVRKYSSGMLVRLGFSIAAHLSAPILLFDEVLAVGDLGFQNKCLRKIDTLHKAGRTVVLVSHDHSNVRKHCSRCIVLDKGGVVFDGPAKEGTERYVELMEQGAT